MSGAKHILAVTTIGSEEAAASLAKQLVERRLVACVNIVGKVRSIYRWKDKVEDDSESVLLMKTRAERLGELDLALKDLHPYDVHELIALPIESGSAAYLGWIDESTHAEREK